MSMNQCEVQRKVRQLDADGASSYEILETVQRKQTEHDARFSVLDGRLDDLRGQVSEVLEVLRSH